MRWGKWISHPWFVLGLAVVGGPGMIEDVRRWVEVLGFNMLTTLALMGLAAHVTAVAFQSGEPYRGWLLGLGAWFKRKGTNDQLPHDLVKLFDANHANGRAAAKLIAATADLEPAEDLLDAFNAASEPKTGRYCPVWAYAALLVKNGDPLAATIAVNQVTMDVSALGHDVEFDEAYQEFFVGAGCDPEALGRVK